jgi:MFS family permease
MVFIIGFSLVSMAMVWLSLVVEMWMLYLFVIVFGFACGGMGASESPLTAWLFGLRSHGLIYGVVHLGFTAGAAIGPFLTGYIYDLADNYNLAFMVCAAFAIIGLISTLIITPTKRLEIGT